MRDAASMARGVVVSLGLLVLWGCQPSDPEATSVGLAASAARHLHYHVQVDPADPTRLWARLELPGEPMPGGTAFVRGMNFGLASQVTAPVCDGVALVASGEAQWDLPEGCGVLSWTIAVEQATPNAVDASLQNSLYFPDTRWWLLSEPTSLLRLGGVDEAMPLTLHIDGVAGSDITVGAVRQDDGAWRLPGMNHAPEFFAFGALSVQRHDLGRLHTTYVIDDEARFGTLPLLDMHRQALSYLADVFQVPSRLPEADRHLLVVWLGIDEALGEAGGAAGSRSFLANYIDGSEENRELNAARTMLVLAHEQVHQLQDLMWGGGPPGPTWLGESFAHYYGLMALARSGLPEEVVALPMGVFIDAERPVDVGLVEYNRRHQAGDHEAYGMFYVQGATLWAEVDRVLRSTAPELGGLDALVPAFLAATDTGGEGLPVPFRELLVEHGGVEMEQVLARYVGE